MPKATQRPRLQGTVLVVSSNAETLDGMHRYFANTGIASASGNVLNPLADLSTSTRALVVFPDDFPTHEALAYLSTIRTRRPDLTVVVVTKEPAVYADVTATDGRSLNALVLPKPAFGWTILDAIRATFQNQTDD